MVGDARVDARHAVGALELCDLASRNEDVEAVDDDRVATPDREARDLITQPSLHVPLLRGQPLPVRGGGRQQAPRRDAGKRRRVERDDDFDQIARCGVPLWDRAGKGRQRDEQDGREKCDPRQIGHGRDGNDRR